MRLSLAPVAGCAVLLASGLFRFVDWEAGLRKFADPAHETLPVYAVARAPFTVTVPAFGELESEKSTPVSVPDVRTGGLKIYWIVKDGSRVKQGDTLVEFDATDLLLQLEEVEGDVEATLREMEATVLRGASDVEQIDSDLFVTHREREVAADQAPRDEELFSRHEILEGQMNVQLADAKLTEFTGKREAQSAINDTAQRILVIDHGRHEAAKGMLQQSLALLKVLAPHDGLVVHEKDQSGAGVNIGETRWRANTLLRIPDITSMRARVYVLESDIGAVKVGQPAWLVVDSNPDQRFSATVDRIDTLARPRDKDSPVKYFEAILRVAVQGSGIVRPGKQVRAGIVTAEYAGVITVPRVALVEESLQYSVWVEEADGPAKRDVQIAPGDRARVVIAEGLAEGERVLLHPPGAGGGETGLRDPEGQP